MQYFVITGNLLLTTTVIKMRNSCLIKIPFSFIKYNHSTMVFWQAVFVYVLSAAIKLFSTSDEKKEFAIIINS